MKYALPLFALLLSSCAANVTEPARVSGAAPQSAQEALRPYYARLDVKLPKAPANPALSDDTVITRFAFGSCVNENRDMKFWDVIAAQKPQAFLLIGDNVYGDTRPTNGADIPTLTASYKKLNSRVEFDRFRRSIPMMTAWDDHDYGANDAGGAFAFKEWAENVYETYWGSSDEVKSRPGVYESRIVGPQGRRVQFIMLDGRFFRSDLATMPYRDPGPTLGWYIPNMDPNATILGKAQWDWLAQELEKPADVRFIISSTQVITDAHNFEGWTNFPKERERLYALLGQKGVNNAIFLTGDRHSGGFYKTTAPGLSKPLWDFTSSSLNFAFGKGDGSDREPDPRRTGGFWGIPNFGQIDIDWAAKKVTMTLRKDDGSVIETQVANAID
ncbi:alkaline phosphatase D family protein [Sphingorhabdus sp.]|uniref:alkaline phosphatase D family protein n=1 Tax=Sphingorhabdus sp. TaxID=1902408 RepID=UPI00391BE353